MEGINTYGRTGIDLYDKLGVEQVLTPNTVKKVRNLYEIDHRGYTEGLELLTRANKYQESLGYDGIQQKTPRIYWDIYKEVYTSYNKLTFIGRNFFMKVVLGLIHFILYFIITHNTPLTPKIMWGDLGYTKFTWYMVNKLGISEMLLVHIIMYALVFHIIPMLVTLILLPVSLKRSGLYVRSELIDYVTRDNILDSVKRVDSYLINLYEEELDYVFVYEVMLPEGEIRKVSSKSLFTGYMLGELGNSTISIREALVGGYHTYDDYIYKVKNFVEKVYIHDNSYQDIAEIVLMILVEEGYIKKYRLSEEYYTGDTYSTYGMDIKDTQIFTKGDMYDYVYYIPGVRELLYR